MPLDPEVRACMLLATDLDCLPHGFIGMGMAPAARRLIDDITAALAALLNGKDQ